MEIAYKAQKGSKPVSSRSKLNLFVKIRTSYPPPFHSGSSQFGSKDSAVGFCQHSLYFGN